MCVCSHVCESMYMLCVCMCMNSYEMHIHPPHSHTHMHVYCTHPITNVWLCVVIFLAKAKSVALLIKTLRAVGMLPSDALISSNFLHSAVDLEEIIAFPQQVYTYQNGLDSFCFSL